MLVIGECSQVQFMGSLEPDSIQIDASSITADYSVCLQNPLAHPEPTWRFSAESLNEHVGQSARHLVARTIDGVGTLNPTAGYAALKFVELVEGSPANELLRQLQQFAIYSPDTATLRRLDSDRQSRDPIGLNGGRLTPAFEDGRLPFNVVLYVPSKDLEARVLSALHPDIADQYSPIECRDEPGALLVFLAPHRLLRRKESSLKKDTGRYRAAVNAMVRGWPNCAHGDEPRCPEAGRFEGVARRLLGLPPN